MSDTEDEIYDELDALEAKLATLKTKEKKQQSEIEKTKKETNVSTIGRSGENLYKKTIENPEAKLEKKIELYFGKFPNVFYYLFDIIILFLLGVIIYYNVIAIDNIKNSKKIIITKTTTCKEENIPEGQVEDDPIKGYQEYYQYTDNPFSTTENIIVSSISRDNFNDVCLDYFCKNNRTSTGTCGLKNQDNYQLCLNLTRPDPGCNNNAKPIVRDDKSDGNYVNYYLVKNPVQELIFFG